MRPSELIRYWAHELAAMARTGRELTTNDYDRDRFERMHAIGEETAAMTPDGGRRRAAYAEVVLADPASPPQNMSLLRRTMLADSLPHDAPGPYQ